MAAFDFPASPTNGQVYTANGVTYVYSSADGAWIGGPISDTGLWQPKDATLTALATLADNGVGLPELDGAGGATFRPAATIAEFRAGVATPRVLGNKSVWDAADFVSVAFATSVALDLATGINFTIPAVSGPITLANPTNLLQGRSGCVLLNPTADTTIAFGLNWKFPGGTKPTLLANGAITAIFYLTAPGVLLCGAGEAYA